MASTLKTNKKRPKEPLFSNSDYRPLKWYLVLIYAWYENKFLDRLRPHDPVDRLVEVRPERELLEKCRPHDIVDCLVGTIP